MESFNKELKRLLEAKYLKDPKNFNIYTELPEIINIYNNNIHSTTKYKPSFLFNCKDNNIIEKVILNIKNSQKKFKDKINGIKPGTKCLISENCKIKNNKIFANKFKKKGKYTIPCIVLGVNGGNEYKIEFPIKIQNYKNNKEYIIDYHLIVECNERVWKEILNNYK